MHAHSENVAAMRNAAAAEQMANAQRQIQRLGSELVAAQETMSAQRAGWENLTMHAERQAAVQGEQCVASVVRANPELAAAWTDGQVVSVETARSEILRVEQQFKDMQRLPSNWPLLNAEFSA